eukprot:g27185.t1
MGLCYWQPFRGSERCGRKVGFRDGLACAHHLLGRVVAILGHYVPGQYAFNGASVEVDEGPYGHANLPDEQEVLCRLDRRIYVGSSGQVVGYRRSKELDALHSLNHSSIDVNGGIRTP